MLTVRSSSLPRALKLEPARVEHSLGDSPAKKKVKKVYTEADLKHRISVSPLSTLLNPRKPEISDER